MFVDNMNKLHTSLSSAIPEMEEHLRCLSQKEWENIHVLGAQLGGEEQKATWLLWPTWHKSVSQGRIVFQLITSNPQPWNP